MLRGNCDKCGENIFEWPNVEASGGLPRKITCLGCGRRFLIQLNDKGMLVFFRMGRKIKKALKPIEF